MKKSVNWMQVLRFCAFWMLVIASVTGISKLVERKQSRDLFEGFLEEPQQYDVLFFGDSQFMNGMLPLEIWEDYGIASYNLSCYGNVLPVSYWTIINALDYADPKLVVLAINGLNEVHKVSNYNGDLHTALDFWPMTINKARMIQDLLTDPEDPDFTDVEGNCYREIKWEYFFKLGKYHSRWKELTKKDYSKRLSYVKGGESLVGIEPIWEYTLVGEDEYADEGGYGYAYLRAAIEACQSRGIEVLLIHLPAPEYINSQRHANTVKGIAEEYGVGFVDTTYFDSIVDYAVDCYDREPHLNMSGTLKMTSFLGSYIHERYVLPDRRNEARYAHWHEQLDAYKEAKFSTICSQTELNHVLMLLHDKDFDVRIAIRPESSVYYDDLSILLMHNMVRDRVLAGEEEERASSFMYPLEGFDEALRELQDYYVCRESDVITEYTGPAAKRATCEVFDIDETSTVMIEVKDRNSGKPAVQMRF